MKPHHIYLTTRFHVKRGENLVNNIFFNLVAFLIIISIFVLIGWGAQQSSKPLDNIISSPISLGYYDLCFYTLRTVLRMFVALVFSFGFTLIYAKLAAINPYFEQILIPLLDILQSVPILGFISFTVAIFLSLFPGSLLGAECACIFAIFTSQAWNMIFSLYYSLKNIPKELSETTQMLRMPAWQKFWRMELPYAMPSLVFNIVVSISSGWFFVVASEVVSVGNTKINLPGIGSYIATALEQGKKDAIFAAIIAIIIVIFCINKLFLEPLLLWSEKFQYSAGFKKFQKGPFVFNLFQKNLWIKQALKPLIYVANFFLYLPLFNPHPAQITVAVSSDNASRFFNYLWYGFVSIGLLASGWYFGKFLLAVITLQDVAETFYLTLFTLFRICTMMIIISLIWLPIGIYIGLRPRFAQYIQPVVQFLAAFPVNLLFPISAIIISRYNLNPNIWLSPLIIIGAQWYILFNIIAGTLAFPAELAEITNDLEIKGFLWWRKVILPAIMPYFLTGLIIAFGAAWNACIVSELINFRGNQLLAAGIGSYIAEKTLSGDLEHISLGIIMMILFVVAINRIIWNPLHHFVLNKFGYN